VENLSGSGAIASAFSKAYRETFTLTYVLGENCRDSGHTSHASAAAASSASTSPAHPDGISALNKLLGREVYTSHMQLGRPKVMEA